MSYRDAFRLNILKGANVPLEPRASDRKFQNEEQLQFELVQDALADLHFRKTQQYGQGYWFESEGQPLEEVMRGVKYDLERKMSRTRLAMNFDGDTGMDFAALREGLADLAVYATMGLQLLKRHEDSL